MRVHSKRGVPIPRATALRWCWMLAVIAGQCSAGFAQSDAAKTLVPETTEQKVERLTAAVSQVQAQMEANQKLLLDLQKQLATLQQQMAAEKAAPPPVAAPTGGSTAGAATTASASLDEIKERQAIDESQIATHELTKVETESKYPLKVSGLILFNGFVNTRRVDIPAAPAYALPGSGSTGFSPRQTVLGLDARGPHLFGAASHADVRVDFFANGTQSGYAAGGILRLRTAHADLRWQNTQAFFELDRSILEPNAPTSLVAGQPELAWAGNLWTWNPQVGLSHQFGLFGSARLQTQIALIDPSDPHLPASATSSSSNVTLAERSRWPGTEARIALLGSATGPEAGLGGYFSPHRTADGVDFDAWAVTADARWPMTKHFEMTANAYRGQALGGLGGGGYVDYFYQYSGGTETTRALDDIGGWAQLKSWAGPKVEFNVGFGIDNPFAKQVHSSLSPLADSYYAGLARNRAYFSNAIYSPSAYLQFSLEYRRMWTNYAAGSTYISDVIGIGAGYKF
jgi:hypothetical protein